jgi:hypothetical protein
MEKPCRGINLCKAFTLFLLSVSPFWDVVTANISLLIKETCVFSLKEISNKKIIAIVINFSIQLMYHITSPYIKCRFHHSPI